MNRYTVYVFMLLFGMLAYSSTAQDSDRIEIIANQNLAIQGEPTFDSDVKGIFESGKSMMAFGRNEDGSWIQVADGWVVSKNVTAKGEINSLPATTKSVVITAASDQTLRGGPDDSFDTVGTFPRGVPTIAIGRNDIGDWLEIQDGWIFASMVDVKGDVMLLPATFAAFTITSLQDAPIYAAPFRTSDLLEIFLDGEAAIAIGRNVDGTAVQTPRGWLFVNYTFTLGGEIEILPVVPFFTANVKKDLILYSLPNFNHELNTFVPAGEQVNVLGRNSKADWLEISGGWVQARKDIDLSGDVMSLPLTGYSNGIKVKYTGSSPATIRSAPGTRSQSAGQLNPGRETIAVGTNREETWLLIAGGWVENNRRLEIHGELIDLPIVDASGETIESSAERKLATPTPVPTPTPTPHPRTVVEYTITRKNESYDLPGWCRVAHSLQRGRDYGFSVAFYDGTDKWYTADVYDASGTKLRITRTHLAGTGDARAEYQRYNDIQFSKGKLYARIREIDTRDTIQIGFNLDEPGHHYLQIVC